MPCIELTVWVETTKVSEQDVNGKRRVSQKRLGLVLARHSTFKAHFDAIAVVTVHFLQNSVKKLREALVVCMRTACAPLGLLLIDTVRAHTARQSMAWAGNVDYECVIATEACVAIAAKAQPHTILHHL